MTLAKRRFPLLALASFITFFSLYLLGRSGPWRSAPQTFGLGEMIPDTPISTNQSAGLAEPESQLQASESQPQVPAPTQTVYDATERNLTTRLVIARTQEENVDWISEQLPDVQTAIYVADDPNAPLHPPQNKGHEVMVYLSYIIDHYDSLPDVSLFMHAHRWAWHNDDLLENDAAQMVKRLNARRVLREGYVNLRCHWYPGCPEWMHPGAVEEDAEKREQLVIAQSWAELFPSEPVPSVLAQPCCAQFALSRDRIHQLPLSKYIFYRDWVLQTPLSDSISGRIFEYVWQYLFTGQNIVCPDQRTCYCDGFGVCFGGNDQFEDWFRLRYDLRVTENELFNWEAKAKAIEDARAEGRLDEASQLEVPELGRDEQLRQQISALKDELESRRLQAIARGDDPRLRAEELGRPWKEGDGF
ncbi:hypothetical protein L228DRAFT_59373 [Xylona heveae TC161]|uniref:Uncharacterized protein n=1 Tax=Xylona heveae (strain CBS 132557 / TC161) TaxID=1328760 RepID=A0A165IJG4_XYLHT|nr:hypothetical protein L228DRAFT_59373 [Xylona heveae TC161]KZF24980.1 hypothetical protein L228DRAFT_59373 [Xylona heveae TC161]